MSTGADALQPSSATAREPLPERVGRYQIQQRLGAGGMGTVYKAHDPQLDRTVALKLPRFDGPVEGRTLRIQRFHREARAAARLWHPHVCPIHDVGEHDGRPFVVMAYVPGRSLAEVLAEQGRFEDSRQAVTITRQILDALGAVHGCGLIHRDLKPGNILLDSAGRPILTDFGLARAENDTEHLTSDGVVVGTPAFMAPEQAAGEGDRIGAWTDVYGVGVLLYQMVTGRLPFEGPALAVLSRILHEAPPSPRTCRPDLDPGLESVLLKALAKEPGQRYSSAAEFAAALSELSAGAAITAELPAPFGPPPLPESVGVGNAPKTKAAVGRAPAGMMRRLGRWSRKWLILSLILLPYFGFALLLAILTPSCGEVPKTMIPKMTARLPSTVAPMPTRKAPPDPALSPALVQALEKSQRVKLAELLNQGADPNAKDAHGETLLMKAVVRNDINILTLLLNKGADPNVQDGDGETLLMKVIARDNLPVLLTLLQRPTLLTNTKDNRGETALMKAAASGRARAVEALLAPRGALFKFDESNSATITAPEVEVNEEDNKGGTALAKAKGHPMIVELLKKAGGR